MQRSFALAELTADLREEGEPRAEAAGAAAAQAAAAAQPTAAAAAAGEVPV